MSMEIIKHIEDIVDNKFYEIHFAFSDHDYDYHIVNGLYLKEVLNNLFNRNCKWIDLTTNGEICKCTYDNRLPRIHWINVNYIQVITITEYVEKKIEEKEV